MLTLPAVTNVGSSFTTGDMLITLHNTGSLPAHVTLEAITNGLPSNTFASEAYICNVDPNNYVDYNGPLSGAGSLPMNWDIPAGGTGIYKVNIYAGSQTTACGAIPQFSQSLSPGTSVAPTLLIGAEGQSILPTVTYSFTA